MHTAFVLFLLLSALIRTQITETVETPLFLDVPNSFQAFQFTASSDNTVRANMDIKCGIEIEKLGLYFLDYNMCGHEFIDEDIAEINEILAQLSVKLGDKPSLSAELSVEYHFEILQDKNIKGSYGMVLQKFKLLKEIPARQLMGKVLLNDVANSNFQIKVMEVDAVYQDFWNSDDMNIVFESNEVPTWLYFEFKDGGLYLMGHCNDALFDDVTFQFKIFDGKTHLTTETFELLIANNGQEKNKPSFFMLVISVLSLFSLVVMILVFESLPLENKEIAEMSMCNTKAGNMPSEITLKSYVKWDFDTAPSDGCLIDRRPVSAELKGNNALWINEYGKQNVLRVGPRLTSMVVCMSDEEMDCQRRNMKSDSIIIE